MAGGQIKLEDGDTGQFAGFEAPASMTSGDVLWKLPAADGNPGQPLITNGSAILSWGPKVYDYSVGTGGDYSTLAAAIAAASAGSSILVFQSETSSSSIDINKNDLKIDFTAGTVITFDTDTADGIIVSGSRVDMLGLNIEANLAATLTNLLRVSGNDNFIRSRINANNASLTVTNAVNLVGDRNQVSTAVRTTLGTVTNTVVNSGTDNDYSVRG